MSECKRHKSPYNGFDTLGHDRLNRLTSANKNETGCEIEYALPVADDRT